MKKILLGFVLVLGLISCSNFGKKIKVEGTKGEVYYKGDGVTEADAKKLGDFLKEQSFFNDTKGASVQLMKDGDGYVMRFVYDKNVYDTLKNSETLFKMIGIAASKMVFDGKKVNVALANTHFKDYKTFAYDDAMAKAMENQNSGNNVSTPDTTVENTGFPNNKDAFDHDNMDGIGFYWYGIPDAESKRIADYIVQNGSFKGGNSEIYMTKENGRNCIRFPMIESARTDAATLAQVAEVSKQIKDNVFPNDPFSFYVTDEKMVTVKAYDY